MGTDGLKEIVQRARDLRAQGDSEGCMHAADSALQHNKQCWPAVACRCWALIQQRRPLDALPALREGVSAAKQPAVLQDLRLLLRQARQCLEDAAFANAPRQATVFTTEPAEIQRLQNTPARVRNICMLAHVDHGKTSLTDGLVASNRIISAKQVGHMRYMDSREDEQDRGITMKASSISLVYRETPPPRPLSAAASAPNPAAANAPLDPLPTTDFLINLIDSPGHIDFSSEVSTAVRVCDGAIVVVDVLEGVCVQTIAVLRQAWQESVKTILVLNKVDRLIVELQLTVAEANDHICRVIENVNAVIGSMFAEELIESRAASIFAADQDGGDESSDGGEDDIDADDVEDSGGRDDEEDEHLYYAPEKGNVAFASAWDGWAFRPSDFADLTARKLGMPRRVLRKSLFGPNYFLPKQRKIVARKNGDPSQTLFVECVLKPLWKVYDRFLNSDQIEARAKIAANLKVDVPARELNHGDKRVALRALVSRWMPLSTALFGAITVHLPSPVDAQAYRLDSCWPAKLRPGSSVAEGFMFQEEQERAAAAADATAAATRGGYAATAAKRTRNDTPAMAASRLAMEACSSSASSPAAENLTIVYVSKIFAVHPRDLPARRWSAGTASKPRAVPPRRRVADSAPKKHPHQHQHVAKQAKSRQEQAAVEAEIDCLTTTKIVASYSQELDVDALVAGTASSTEIARAEEQQHAERLADPVWVSQRSAELSAKLTAGTITDEEGLESQQLIKQQALNAQAARLHKLGQPGTLAIEGTEKERVRVMNSTENYVAASAFLGAKQGYLFQTGPQGLGYYATRPGTATRYLQADLNQRDAQSELERQVAMLTRFYREVVTDSQSTKDAAACRAIIERRRGDEPAMTEESWAELCEKLNLKYGKDPRFLLVTPSHQKTEPIADEVTQQPEAVAPPSSATLASTNGSDGGPWSCKMCLQPNEPGKSSCAICLTPRPAATSAPSVMPAAIAPTSAPVGEAAAAEEPLSGPWMCKMCLQSNTADAKVCSTCLTPKPTTCKPKQDAVPAKVETKEAGPWKCGICLQPNDVSALACTTCLTPKPSNNTKGNNSSSCGPNALRNSTSATATTTAAEHHSAGMVPTVDESNFDETFVAVGRVFCGTLRTGDKIYVIGPDGSATQIVVGPLYTLMGRQLEVAHSCSAGNVCGIGELSRYIHRCGTLSTDPGVPPFVSLRHQTQPIVRVAVSPDDPAELATLANGLQLLTRADPAAQTLVEPNGDYVLIASGEVHLQVCLKDLRERFAKIPFQQSALVVPFRETVVAHGIIGGTGGDLYKAGDPGGPQLVSKLTSCKTVNLKVKAVPLPQVITRFLQENAPLLRRLSSEASTATTAATSADTESEENAQTAADAVRNGLAEALKAADDPGVSDVEAWLQQLERVVCFGPNQIGPNILLNCIDGYRYSNGPFQTQTTEEAHLSEYGIVELEHAIVTGFQLATQAGPLCEEPLTGVCFELTAVEISGVDRTKHTTSSADKTAASHADPKSTARAEGSSADKGAGETTADDAVAKATAELMKLGARALRSEARSLGVDGDAINAALESSVPKKQLIRLILIAKAGHNPESETEPEADSTPEAEQLSSQAVPRVEMSASNSSGGLDASVREGEGGDGHGRWQCAVCRQLNEVDDIVCDTCLTPRPDSVSSSGAAGDAGVPGLTRSLLQQHPQLSGSVISTMTQACRLAFSCAPVRIVEPVYDCRVIATGETIGDAHAVLARRRAKVVGQDMREGSLLYEISAWLPVVESLSAWDKMAPEEKSGGGGAGGGSKTYSTSAFLCGTGCCPVMFSCTITCCLILCSSWFGDEAGARVIC